MRIIANGLYELDTDGYTRSVVYVSGVDGGATMALSKATGKPLTDGTIVIDGEYTIGHGRRKTIYVEVTGVTGTTDITITTHGLS